MNITLPTQTAPDLHPGLITAVVSALRDRSRGRAEARRIERDLASYTSRADRDELYAMLDRYDDETTRPIRRILARRPV